MTLPFILAGPTLPFEEVNATSLTAYSQLHGKAAMTLPIQPATNAAGVANPVFLYSVDGQESVVKPLPSVRSDSTRVVQWCRALEQLPRHDNVVVPSHVVFSRGSAFLVMPYTRSYNLTEYRRQVYGGGPLPEEAVRLLALDILCGLYHLRVHSLVHRNLHPGNVLVDASTGVGRLTDLSYAQVLHNGAAALPLERRHESAWAWTDPALAHLTTSHHTHHELDNNTAAATRTATTAATPAVDIWGFGMLLHAMCGATGKPFVYPSNGDLSAIVAKEYMTSIYSDDLMDLLRLCLNPDPTRRPTVFQIMKHNFIFPAVLLALEASRIPGKPSATGFSGAFSGLATQIRQSSLLENMATAVGGVKERASGLFSALFASVNNSPASTPLPATTTATTSATGTTNAPATDTITSGTTPLLQQSASSAEHTPPPSLTSMPDREKVMSITTEGVHAPDTTGTQAASTGASLLQPHKDTTQMTQTGQNATTTTAATTTTPHTNASQQQTTTTAAGHATLTSTPSLAPRLIHHELVCGTKLSNRNQIETSSHGQPQLLADYGLLFDIEVRNGTLVLEDLFFSAAAARNTMLVQLWWRPVTSNNNNRAGGGAATTSAMQSDITSATFVPSEMRLAGPPQAANEATTAAGVSGGENGWHAVLPLPKQLSNITPRAILAVGPFQLPLHTNPSANGGNNNRAQGDVEDRPRRYSLLLCTNSPHGVRYYGAAHGLVEREVGEVLEEDAAMAVYMGVACGHAVWRALAGDKSDMTTNSHNQAHNNSNTTTTTTTATAQTGAAAAAGHVVLGGNTNNNNKQACSPAEGPHTMQSTREGHSEEAQGTHTVTHVHVDAEPPTLTEALSETVVQETHAKGLCGSLKYSILD